jgi:hypothetical protein
MTIVVDLTDVEAWKGGGILPPGWHLCRIEAADDTQHSRNGFDQLIVEWSALKGEHAGLGITEWLVVTPLSYGKVKAFLNAVGIATDEGEVRIEPDVLRGRQAMIFVQNEPDRNDPEKVRSRVKAHDRAVGIAAPAPAAAAASMARHDDIPF